MRWLLRLMKKILTSTAALFAAVFLIFPCNTLAQSSEEPVADQTQEVQTSINQIRNPDGMLYAYIVLLFNDNPHFVNLIQEGSIPASKFMQPGDFNIREYRNYLNSVKTQPIYTIAAAMYDVYMNPVRYTKKDLEEIERALEARKVILRFSANHTAAGRASIDYCIYGMRSSVSIKHPLFEVNEKIFNIRPLIYYDEFSTSNSTFYFDMIYINPDEVKMDYQITRNILLNKNVDMMFFVGSRVSDDIKACLKKAFSNSNNIRDEIWRMFVIHEITHKILDNHYNFYDQVIGEEMALTSTIYANPYLGLAVMYSYIDYNSMNPHRIAALNYLRFVAQETSNKKIVDDPSQIKNLPEQEILRVTKLHFLSLKKVLK